MKAFNMKYIQLAAVLAVSLTACTHVSQNIGDDGMAGEVIFPAPEKVILKEGTFPTVEALRQVGPGVSKDQLYQLLGRPHFNEGLAGVREWDYLFHFRVGNEVTTCQYKVIFDKDYHGQSFHWLPAGCADLLQEEEVVGVPAAQESVTLSLSADSLFRFGGAEPQDILPGGMTEIEGVATKLQQMKAGSVVVVGHTDRIGNEADNQALSQRRADTVQRLLIEKGIDATIIQAVGRGESAPVSQGCSGEAATPALVQCLQPDRRVEVIARGVQ